MPSNVESGEPKLPTAQQPRRDNPAEAPQLSADRSIAFTEVSPRGVPTDTAYPPESRLPRLLQIPVVRGLIAYALLSTVLGVVVGLVWHAVVELPSYTIAEDRSANPTERGLTEFFGTDAWFATIGLPTGLMLGWLAWRWFRRIGWLVLLVGLGGAAQAAAFAWQMGELLGPNNFADRISTAGVGEQVSIDFQLHGAAAVLVWLIGGVIPVLLGSSLGRDDSDPQPLRRQVRRKSPTINNAPD